MYRLKRTSVYILWHVSNCLKNSDVGGLTLGRGKEKGETENNKRKMRNRVVGEILGSVDGKQPLTNIWSLGHLSGPMFENRNNPDGRRFVSFSCLNHCTYLFYLSFQGLS